MTSTPEEQFKTTVWHLFARHHVTCIDAIALVDDLPGAAQAYAAGDSDQLVAMRRAVLTRTRPRRD
jgi:hypothetical protein